MNELYRLSLENAKTSDVDDDEFQLDEMNVDDDGFVLSNEAMVNESNWKMVKSGFHEDLTLAIEYCRANTNRKTFYKSQEAKDKITNVIKKYTGMSVRISSEYGSFAMMPPDVNKNHTLVDGWQREYYNNKELKRFRGKMKSMVDIKEFRVSGDFANVTISLFIDPHLFFNDQLFTSAQISAILLHEVGHMFSYFALSADTYSINIPLLGTLNRLAKTESTEQIEIILKEHNTLDTTLTKVSPSELSKKDKKVIVTAIISNQIQDTTTIMKHRDYEEVNTESLADKFAVRCGAGADLAMALDILMQLHGSRYRSMFNLVLFELNLVFILIMLGFLTATTGIFILPMFIYVPIFFGVLNAASNAGDGTYDKEINRFTRMREDMISMLKNPDINESVTRRIRYDIQVVDSVLKNYRDNKSLIGLMVDLILPSKRRLMSQTEMYRELENLSANDLFVAAYDLKNL